MAGAPKRVTPDEGARGVEAAGAGRARGAGWPGLAVVVRLDAAADVVAEEAILALALSAAALGRRGEVRSMQF